jgi:hypothetical protein
MAKNYYDMTGVLILDKITPVIKALFGVFELDETYPGNGQAYIANMSEGSSCSWEYVLEKLQELVEELGLALPEDAEDTIEEHLYVLATHFGADENEVLSNLIEHNVFEDDADLDSLFTIAKAFDDGHGLKAYKTETAWHCSAPRLFEFGGAGDFTGMHVSVGNSSNQIVALGERLEAALSASDTDKAADILREKVGNILSGIYDATTRDVIRSKLSNLLAEPKTKWFVVTGRLPGDDEDSCHTFNVATREEAFACFTDAMYEDDDSRTRDNIQKEFGVEVFVNSICSSDSPITDVS